MVAMCAYMQMTLLCHSQARHALPTRRLFRGNCTDEKHSKTRQCGGGEHVQCGQHRQAGFHALAWVLCKFVWVTLWCDCVRTYTCMSLPLHTWKTPSDLQVWVHAQLPCHHWHTGLHMLAGSMCELAWVSLRMFSEHTCVYKCVCVYVCAEQREMEQHDLDCDMRDAHICKAYIHIHTYIYVSPLQYNDRWSSMTSTVTWAVTQQMKMKSQRSTQVSSLACACHDIISLLQEIMIACVHVLCCEVWDFIWSWSHTDDEYMYQVLVPSLAFACHDTRLLAQQILFVLRVYVCARVVCFGLWGLAPNEDKVTRVTAGTFVCMYTEIKVGSCDKLIIVSRCKSFLLSLFFSCLWMKNRCLLLFRRRQLSCWACLFTCAQRRCQLCLCKLTARYFICMYVCVCMYAWMNYQLLLCTYAPRCMHVCVVNPVHV